VIRIPLSEEEVVVTKHPVQVTEVSVSKNEITEMKQVHETLKKEQVHYEVIGLVDVKDGDSLEEVQGYRQQYADFAR
jgi:stress response protein YsnF